MHTPTNDKPNVLPANVAKIVAELQRLTVTGKPDGRGARSRATAQDARVMVIEGNERAAEEGLVKLTETTPNCWGR